MFREDINVVGVPLTAITNATYSDARQRQLFKNIIYVGALSVLLDIDETKIQGLFGEQFKGKEKLIDSNVKALQLGRDWVKQHIDADAVKLKVRPSNNVGNRIFVEGNNAAALGAVYGGATVCAWYPITPSSSLAEAFQSHCKRLRHDKETGKAKYAIVQAEDELASIGMVIGAGWNGARAFTSHLGPGHLADDRVHRPRLLRRSAGGDRQRAARRSVDRHADAHAAVRPAQLRLRLATATPSTCCCSPRTRRSASTSPPRRSTSPTGCRRRCSS